MAPRRLLAALLLLAATAYAQTATVTIPGDPPQKERKFAALTAEEIKAIDDAAPARARANPASPRRVLVFDRTEGFVHASIPFGNEALRRIGEKTGAFTVTVSSDMAAFDAASLATYDTVIFQNTTRLAFNNPAHRTALLEFVKSGKGLVGIHAATDNFPTWPEGQALIGGVFHGHPWNAGDTSAVKLDEPKHTLNAAFGGRGFWIREEIYQIDGPYGRDRQRVLMSLDMSRPENARPPDKIKRTDNDFPISWIKTHGAGRVFYTSLGHNKDIFTTPILLAHLLDGIQFALGDLPADAVPSASLKTLPEPALAPDDKTTIQKLAARPALDPWDALAAFTREQQPFEGPKAVTALLRALPPAERAVHEPRLLALAADTSASVEARREAMLLLSLTATPATIPVLESLGRSADFAAVSAKVLTGLPLKEAESARIRLLKDALEPATQILWANTFSLKPSPAALPHLIKLAKAPAPVGTAALEAISALSSRDAFRALTKLETTPERESARRAALLAAGDRVLRSDPSSSTKRLVAKHAEAIVRDAAVSAVECTSAARLLLLARGPAAAKDLLPLLSSPDTGGPLGREIGLIADKAIFDRLVKDLGSISPVAQISLLTAVGERPTATALPFLQHAITHAAPEARPAAAIALGRSGDLSALDALLPLLGTPGALADAAREALGRLKAPGTESMLRERAASGAPAQRAAVLGLLAARQDRSAFQLLVAACSDADDTVRAAAFGAVVSLVRTGDLAAVLQLMKQAKRPADRREWRKALAAAAAIESDGAVAARLLNEALTSPGSAERPALIAALSTVNHPDAVAALSVQLAAADIENRKEVIRALSAARTEGAFQLLLAQAKRATDQGERVLALRGYLDTLTNLPYFSRSRRLAAYSDAWPLADRREEKQAILDAVKRISGNEAAAFVKAREAELAEPAR